LVFEQSAKPEELSVRRQDGKWLIRAGRSHGFARGIGLALAGVETAETIGFETLGFLFDCTRGNVVTVDAPSGRLPLRGEGNVGRWQGISRISVCTAKCKRNL